MRYRRSDYYCGVGVHAPEDVKLVKEAGGDAAFVGSTILKLHEDIPAMYEREDPGIQSAVLDLSFKYNHNIMKA